MTTLASLYPQARKLQYDLKTQVDFLESGRSTDLTQDQQSARMNLHALQNLLGQLESMVQMETSTNREMWKKKIQQLRDESNYIGASLEQYLYQMNRSVIEAHERESLFARRSGAVEANTTAMYATQENQSLNRSSEMVNNLSGISQAVLSNLKDQGTTLKSAHRKVLDIANRLGLSNSLLRVIERRETVDRLIVFGGMFLTLGFLPLAFSRPTTNKQSAPTQTFHPPAMTRSIEGEMQELGLPTSFQRPSHPRPRHPRPTRGRGFHPRQQPAHAFRAKRSRSDRPYFKASFLEDPWELLMNPRQTKPIFFKTSFLQDPWTPLMAALTEAT